MFLKRKLHWVFLGDEFEVTWSLLVPSVMVAPTRGGSQYILEIRNVFAVNEMTAFGENRISILSIERGKYRYRETKLYITYIMTDKFEKQNIYLWSSMDPFVFSVNLFRKFLSILFIFKFREK